jgi:hypothetical protein
MDEKMEWDVGKPYIISMRTPWDIFKSSLLWFIWCQKCEQDLRKWHFHLGIILFRSWQTTVHVGMVAWKELHGFKKSNRKQKKLVAKFKKVWTQGGLFYKNSGRLHWQIMLNSYYIPKHMVDHRSGLLIRPLVQVFSVHESNTNNNSLRDDEKLQRSPTPQSFQPSQLEHGNE